MLRAAHQVFDTPVVFEDPLAVSIIGKTRAASLHAEHDRWKTSLVVQRLRALLAVRSRMAEDTLDQAVAAGIRQYVVLGAGLDTFAYRNPHPGLRVFEVDHPATQAWKRQRLAECGIAIPDDVVFVGADLSKQRLSTTLASAGVDADAPSFFSWLGVTPYLTPQHVLSTLEDIAGFVQHDGGVVFDYFVAPDKLRPEQRGGLKALADLVEANGEPFRGFFETDALRTALTGMGFRDVRDMGPQELNAGYLAGRADGLQVNLFARVVTARATLAQTSTEGAGQWRLN